MKEKYFRPTVTNFSSIANALHNLVATPLLVAVVAAHKLLEARPLEKRDGLKILEKK